MLKLTLLVSLTVVCLQFYGSTATVTCSGEQFFEYKFKPLQIRPIKAEDIENSKARCDEKKCDVVISLFGKNDKCKKGRKVIRMASPTNVNDAREFRPDKYPTDGSYKKFHQWAGEDNQFQVEVCDADTIGSNDQLLSFQIVDMREGCHVATHRDRHPEHPWEMKYEICCRKTGAGGNVYGNNNNNNNNRNRGRNNY